MAGIFLDSHLLLLLVVGTASRAYIRMHKRLREYSEEDYDLLLRLVLPVPNAFVTPNTLTETSNLIGYIAAPARSHIYSVFRGIIQQVEERYHSSSAACAGDHFIRLGLTDAVLLDITDSQTVLITADHDLYLAAVSDGNLAINFNHQLLALTE